VGSIAVLATRNTEFYAGRVFNAADIRAMRSSLQPMAWPWLAASAAAQERGWTLVTADQVADPAHVQLIAYDWTPDAERLVASGARPAALVSFEPPVIAWSLYLDLPRLSRLFEHVFLFEGARARVSTCFHSLAFPLPCPPPDQTAPPWRERRFMAMVNSNKALPRATDPRRWLDRPREVSLKRALAAVRYRPIARDRYAARLAAIDAFADCADFDLYGEGWHQRHPSISPRLHTRALRVYRGSVHDKLRTLGGYRFGLAIENTRFPGYVSEKLFDCLFAGTIPVYDGAPDVVRDVPPEAFVDASWFADYAALERFLRDMTEADAHQYLEAGQSFLRSPAFERFCCQTFARELVDALDHARRD
jgi:alpha(1,3/1,4) fucosyltransferase